MLQQITSLVFAITCLVNVAFASVAFPNTPWPYTDEQRHKVLHPSSGVIGDRKLLSPVGKNVQGGYQLLARTGDSVGAVTIGGVVTEAGLAVYEFGDNFTKGDMVDVSVNPDFMSFILQSAGDTKIDAFVHFESPTPSSLYHMSLSQDPSTGTLTVQDAQMVDWSGWGGLWTPCAGSLTPWNTHLGSEEYEPDAALLMYNNLTAMKEYSSSDFSSVVSFMRYYNIYVGDLPNPEVDGANLIKKFFKPYKYGHITEVSMTGPSTWVPMKWYTLGRLSHEMGKIMPDNKTVYLTDDGNYNRAFFKFVADNPADFSSGSLYAAKLLQLTPSNGTMDDAKFNVSWIKLGSGNQRALSEMTDLSFTDIFNLTAPADDGSCPSGMKLTNSSKLECLSVMPGMDMAAAFFESRRYASYLGATVEFVKPEGLAVYPSLGKLYMSLTEISKSMNKVDNATGDDVQVQDNVCGCVVQLDLDQDWNAFTMEALVCGQPSTLYPNNTCYIDGIAQPDNVHELLGQGHLLIGEDAPRPHFNNYVWTINLLTKELTRILSVPVGAETTGTYAYTINAWTYIAVNAQHPNDDEELAATFNATNSGTNGYIGYVGPIYVNGTNQIQFENSPVPVTNEQMQSVIASKSYTTGLQRQYFTYEMPLRSGQKVNSSSNGNSTEFGQLVTQDKADVFKYACPLNSADLTPDNGFNCIESNDTNAVENAVSNAEDGVILMRTCDGIFMVNHFEEPNPSQVYISKMEQGASGRLTAVSTGPIDFSNDGGVWTPCSASMSYPGYRFGGEEYEPDARTLAEATSMDVFTSSSNGTSEINQLRYFGKYYPNINVTDMRTYLKPYLYGYNFLTVAHPNGTFETSKLFAASRASHELAYLMPDHKTLYSTDDGTNVGFFKFVADRELDFTSGSLYMAKMTQLSDFNGGEFIVEWILLGSGNDTFLRANAENTTFPMIFNTAQPDMNATTNDTMCPAGFSSINTAAGVECLQVKPGMRVFAAFYETRRYGSMLGATTEFSKWEGFTFDLDTMTAFTTLTEVRYGMEDFMAKGKPDDAYDMGGHNDVRLPYNPCGCVYAMSTSSDYNIYFMKGEICGMYDSVQEDVKCNINGLANPDNIANLYGHRQLFIQEDTEVHLNDFGWMYDLETKALTRCFVTPFGAEVTGGYWFENYNGFSYLTVAVQHPYGEDNADKVNDPMSFGIQGAVGYLGPFITPDAYKGDDTLAETCKMMNTSAPPPPPMSPPGISASAFSVSASLSG